MTLREVARVLRARIVAAQSRKDGPGLVNVTKDDCLAADAVHGTPEAQAAKERDRAAWERITYLTIIAARAPDYETFLLKPEEADLLACVCEAVADRMEPKPPVMGFQRRRP